MGDTKSEIIDEVKQLLEQYRQEVPGRRRAWPASIKNRVSDLHAAGATFSEISKRTGLSYDHPPGRLQFGATTR